MNSICKICILFLLVLSGTFSLKAQTAPGRYWVQFSDKDHVNFNLQNPQEFLSDRCIQKRSKYGIGYDDRDLPIDENYVQQVLNTGFCQVVNRSKWFNAITIFTLDTTLIETIALLPFVSDTRSVQSIAQGDKDLDFLDKTASDQRILQSEDVINEYGPSFTQLSMLNGHLLHEINKMGSGMHIAILDAGWNHADQLPCFDHIRDDGRLLGKRDFVFGDDQVYSLSNHGTYVWSILAGIIPDSLIGSAPEASYYLFRTEDPSSEYVVEEDNWVAAMEYCDSLGVDIVNSSLGYSLFEDSLQNHTYADMDGNTTRISISGDIAAAKGILVVNSAGNSGDNPWHYITAPSDGDSVLCIGAVDGNRIHANFSSFGPSSDGDVKPNVSAMGKDCVFAALDSTISRGNGTSFSSPVIAGMAACLWQAFPEKNNMEIFRAIEKSAHLYQNPNDSLGYGIPNFWLAYQSLADNKIDGYDTNINVWPSLFHDFINLSSSTSDPANLSAELYDSTGRLVDAWSGSLGGTGISVVQRNGLSRLSEGAYLLRISTHEQEAVFHLIKE